MVLYNRYIELNNTHKGYLLHLSLFKSLLPFQPHPIQRAKLNSWNNAFIVPVKYSPLRFLKSLLYWNYFF